MRRLVVIALLLVVPIAFGTTKNKPKNGGEYDIKKCQPKVVSHTDGKSPDFHFRKDETYRNSPVVAFDVLESGETTHIVLKRSSGAAEVDQYAPRGVHEMKFNNRPGCGVIETSMDITIDFR